MAEPLRALGHSVYAPSFTGMGDRAHLLGPRIDIETFVEDLVQLIVSEELRDVVLVGHSFGGVPVSGVADRIPEAIGHLVYLDAIVPESGKSVFSTYPAAEAQARIEAAERANGGLAAPAPLALPQSIGLRPGSADYDWVLRRLTPHPMRTYTSALTLRNLVGNGLPRTYVHCSEPSYATIEGSRALVRSWPGWRWIELRAPHEAMITHPDEIARILLAI
ncbi:Alpha/beta hydrolase [Methylocella tundrae]|uniref:Alpha/beta hydrolase n=1 Tax=Methylocella tundrae TaxID=227605 RepID=A0A8B6M8A0_METTU|nr:Alpha/beta hydrolase [Methylocella tundrae]